jgi:DUF1365 family protein
VTRASCLYEGVVEHRRHAPVPHRFRRRLLMVYLDVAVLPEVFVGGWLWSARRPALARFHRADHLGDPSRPLDVCVRELVETHTGRRPAGPIRLLTQVRQLGYVFNPVSFYYGFDADGLRLEWVVAEVTNTPWNERHCYVLDRGQALARGPWLRFRTPKALHVSPFLPMDLQYEWRLREPGPRLSVRIRDVDAQGRALLDASLVLRRRELGARALGSALARHPLLTAGVIGGIYWEAFRLRRKGAPVFPHPGEAAPEVAP